MPSVQPVVTCRTCGALVWVLTTDGYRLAPHNEAKMARIGVRVVCEDKGNYYVEASRWRRRRAARD